jgi:hypothetical protein
MCGPGNGMDVVLLARGFTATDETGESMTGCHFNGHTIVHDPGGRKWTKEGDHPLPSSVRRVEVVLSSEPAESTAAAA